MNTLKTGRLTSDETLALWQAYKDSGDARVRDRLVLTLAPLVKYIVYRKIREIPARCEVEDFISCGLEALIRSIDRYDPAKGSSLEQFVWTRVHGAVLDELRRSDWAPRSVRRRDREINRAREQFVALHGAAPTRQELSDAVGIPIDDLIKHQGDVSRSEVGSLNTVVLAEDDSTIERIDTLPSDDRESDPEFAAMRERACARLLEALDDLPERDRKVAVLLYVYELTLREIGEILGITESRVCQIHGQLRRRLRTELEADQQLFAAVV
jgi:RNA polymerase sigma factor for flagellar operon FliA